MLLHLAMGLGLLLFGRAMLRTQLAAAGVQRLTWYQASTIRFWPRQTAASAIAALALQGAGVVVLLSAVTG